MSANFEGGKKCLGPCGTWQPLAHYSRNASRPDGRCQRCKACEAARVKAHHEKHGRKRKRDSPERVAWDSMKQRCHGAGREDFKRYGGRGIVVCDRWLKSFKTFLADMGPRPSPRHSLDRIDNDGNYCPENCRWATKKDQQNNMRNNVVLTMNGVSRTTAQWSEILGIRPSALRARIRRGWAAERVLQTPAGKYERRA